MVALCAIGFSVSPLAPALAQSQCYMEANLPYTGTGATGHFASVRNSSKSNAAGPGKRYHKGFDANIAPNTPNAGPVINVDGTPKNCDIKKPEPSLSANGGNGVPYGALNPTPGKEWIYNTDPGGYGYYMVFDCGVHIGKELLVRYAHIYGKIDNPSTPVLTGRTAIKTAAPHVHVEFALEGTLADPECLWGQVNSDKGCPVAGRPNLCSSDWDTMKNDCPTTKMPVNSSTNCQSKIPGSGTNTAVGDAQNTQPDTPHSPSEMHEGGNTNDEGDGDVPAGPITGPPGYNPPTGEPPGNPEPPETGTGGGSDADVSEGGGAGGSPNLVPKPKPGEEPEELSGCATDTWTAMVNQSVMQTRREDITNKRYIVKPDSVLDYSCFDSYIKKTAEFAGPIFSETKNWANITVPLIGKTVQVQRELGSKSLDNALMDVVQSAAINYRRGQFNNEFLANSANVPTRAGMTNCDVMSQVWKAAKCKNFDDIDVFYTFEDLAKPGAKDPREFPPNMKCDQ